MENLQGKVAVITGGASGIGRGIADRAAQRGMKLVLADIEQEALDTATKDLREQGADVVGVLTDVSKLEAIEALRDAALDAYGAVHLVCNNAGVGGGGRIWEAPIEMWRWVIDVDLWSVIYGCRVFVPLLIEQGEGHVVNTASLAGLTSTPGMGPYTVAKFGVVALTETLHHELYGTGVAASVLCPAWVNTKVHESQRNAPADVTQLMSMGERTPEHEAMSDFLRQLVESGMDPGEVGEHVLTAVEQQRFYIITHPESRERITQRAQHIVEDKNPALGFG